MDEGSPRKKPLIPVVALAAVVLAATAVGLWPSDQEPATAVPAPSVSAAPPAPVEVDDFTQVRALLTAQNKALLAGDEAGWLAPVDKKLHSRYRTIFRNLRALDITSADMGIDGDLTGKGATRTAKVGLSYCFSGTQCPAYRLDPTAGPPKLINKVTWTARDGSWVITKSAASGVENYLQPAPWENTALTVARGKRVIVAGPKSQAANIKRVLPLAEKAATVGDRYAGMLNNPQTTYRIYLADNKSWKTWYDGAGPPWSTAYYLPLNRIGSDIVLKAGQVLDGSNRYVTEVIQHEMGHAATLNGTRNSDGREDMWLSEGIAEYIGYQPAKARDTYSADALRHVRSRRGAVKTIAVSPLSAKSDDLAVARLYATGHFAAACMAEKYGEKKMLEFVALVLHEGMALDGASQIAFRKPFKTVDKACVSWIKRQL